MSRNPMCNTSVMADSHRKRCKRFDIPGDPHFLTFSCFRRMPLLSRNRSRQWVIDALSRSRESGQIDLWAYVIMPEHVHVVLLPHKEVTISEVLKSVKQSVSCRALLWLRQNDKAFLQRLEVFDRSNDHRSYRFWQRGGGYDRNLRTVSDVHEKIAYVHNNPVRRGWVERAEQWPWSSAAAWESGIDQPLAIDRSSVPRLVETGS